MAAAAMQARGRCVRRRCSKRARSEAAGLGASHDPMHRLDLGRLDVDFLRWVELLEGDFGRGSPHEALNEGSRRFALRFRFKLDQNEGTLCNRPTGVNVDDLTGDVTGLHAGAGDIDGIGFSGAREMRRTWNIVHSLSVPRKVAFRSTLTGAFNGNPVGNKRPRPRRYTRVWTAAPALSLQNSLWHLQDLGQPPADQLRQVRGNPAIKKLMQIGVV